MVKNIENIQAGWPSMHLPVLCYVYYFDREYTCILDRKLRSRIHVYEFKIATSLLRWKLSCGQYETLEIHNNKKIGSPSVTYLLKFGYFCKNFTINCLLNEIFQ